MAKLDRHNIYVGWLANEKFYTHLYGLHRMSYKKYRFQPKKFGMSDYLYFIPGTWLKLCLHGDARNNVQSVQLFVHPVLNKRLWVYQGPYIKTCLLQNLVETV